jgi:hypothetical protein
VVPHRAGALQGQRGGGPGRADILHSHMEPGFGRARRAGLPRDWGPGNAWILQSHVELGTGGAQETYGAGIWWADVWGVEKPSTI